MDESIWKPDDDFGQQHRPMLEELSDEQLRPIVVAMAGEPVSAFTWRIDIPQLGNKGFYGYKLVPLFSYTTVAGREGSCRCCLKQVSPLESPHYVYLHRHGIPLCEVYGAIRLADDAEIIAIEYLDRIGGGDLDDAGREWFLRVKARINAVPVDAFYRADAIAAPKSDDRSARRQSHYERLFDLAESGDLGDEFQKLCTGKRDAIASFETLARQIDSQVAEMPLAICNLELASGYRPGTDERRCFDLHSTQLMPRYTDLRQIAGLPDGVRDGWGDAWHPRERWVHAYVDAYNSLSDTTIRESDVFEGARSLWMQHALDPGWNDWFLNRALSGEEGIRETLYSVLSHLLRTV